MASYSPLPEELRIAKPASETTRRVNASLLSKLDFSDRRNFDKGQYRRVAEVLNPAHGVTFASAVPSNNVRDYQKDRYMVKIHAC